MISVECEQQLRPSTVQLTAPPCISESLFIITNVDDHDEEKRAEQNLFVHSGKSKAEVINNRRLRSTYFTIEANYLQPWSIITYAASPRDCDSWASCYLWLKCLLTGPEDNVRCYYCDGGLKKWQPTDDPWTEHRRWFSRSAHLQTRQNLPQTRTQVGILASFMLYQ